MRLTTLSLPVLLLVLLGGLLAPAPVEARRYLCAQCGTVERVDRIWFEGRDSGREGAVVGAIIGGAIGNQAGRGGDRAAATVAGAVIGGLIGNRIDRNDRNHRGEPGLRLVLRMDRGGYQTIEVAGDMRIHRGNRVRLDRGRIEIIR